MMQGISNTRHRHLIEALLQLENILEEQGATPKEVIRVASYRKQLTEMKANYDHLVSELSTQIDVYFEEYDNAKVKFVSVKLRELKRQKLSETKMLRLSKNNINRSYGT